MRDVVTTGLELAGLACVVAAAFDVGVAVGLATLGLILVTVGIAAGRG
jgi:hypothetical protein